MKNSLLILLFVTFSVPQLFSQTPTFSKGDRVLNLGLGFGTTLYSGSYYKSQVPPLSASFEVGVADQIIDDKGVIGVGGYLGYSSYKYEYNNWGWKYSNLIIGVRGNFHYPLVDNLDTYTGLLLGYNISSASEFGTSIGSDYNASSGGLVASWFIGGRYYFKENLAAMLELGYGVTFLNFGVAFKF